MLHTLNLGILAHVDAGKTTLTERLLHAAGVIDEIGSVDDGSTQTDSLALERQRGITIKSAVVSFALDDLAVNLIDTPGHPDFVAEVERVLDVLDGAVLVVSAVEGVQPQTRVLMRALQRLRIPTLVFVNKIDRSGAQYEPLLRSIAERLSPATIAMTSVSGLGTRAASAGPRTGTDATFVAGLADLVADTDEALLAAYVDDPAAVSHDRLRAQLAAQSRQALVHPVFFGSAITGAGVDLLSAGIRQLLPAASGDPEGPLSARVFKVERSGSGEKVAYVRMFSGTIIIRDRVALPTGARAKVTDVSVFDHGCAVRRDFVRAGQIGTLRGLREIRIGDHLGAARAPGAAWHFAPPTLETVVEPARPRDRGALHVALTALAEQDPLIDLRHDELRRETSVSLYGEVQKEVIEATLRNDFGVEATFRETTTICIERPVGTGEAVETITVEPNPFLATVGLRVEPAPAGAGVRFRLGVEAGAMPSAFFSAVEETVQSTLAQGLYGWRVTDCTVTMTASGYWARQSSAHGGFDKSMSSTAGDFRHLTPLVLMAALQRAGTRVHEPVLRFRLEVPADSLGTVLPALARLHADPEPPEPCGASYTMEGRIPAALVHRLQQQLPTLTSGEGVLESGFDHYREVGGRPPTRRRTDADPLNRRVYLQRVVRRTSASREGA